MPFIKFMNAVKSLLPCLLKSLWKCYLWVQLTVLNLMWLLINGNKINYVTTKHSKESKLLPAKRTFISIWDFTYIKKLKRKHKLWPEKMRTIVSFSSVWLKFPYLRKKSCQSPIAFHIPCKYHLIFLSIRLSQSKCERDWSILHSILTYFYKYMWWLAFYHRARLLD